MRNNIVLTGMPNVEAAPLGVDFQFRGAVIKITASKGHIFITAEIPA
jgi:hypothetical protein